MPEAASTNEEQERRRLFQDIWGDAPETKTARRTRKPKGAEEIVPPAGLVAPGNDLQEIKLQLAQLRENLETLRGVTEEGFGEIRRTMLRLAEAVQTATGRPPRRRD